MVRRDSGKEGWELWKIIALFKTKKYKNSEDKKDRNENTITEKYYMLLYDKNKRKKEKSNLLLSS